MPSRPSSPDQWDGKAKLAAVIKTAPMNEAARSIYCRERGLYVVHIPAQREHRFWRKVNALADFPESVFTIPQ